MHLKKKRPLGLVMTRQRIINGILLLILDITSSQSIFHLKIETRLKIFVNKELSSSGTKQNKMHSIAASHSSGAAIISQLLLPFNVIGIGSSLMTINLKNSSRQILTGSLAAIPGEQ